MLQKGLDVLTLGSLFTGAGGLDIAIRKMYPDSRFSWFSEVDDPCSEVFSYHHPDVPNLGDVTKIPWEDVETVDVMVGGFPCQDISNAGKRKGIKRGTRSGLWFDFAEGIRVLRPRYVFLENVAGINYKNGPIGVVLRSLALLGYDAEWGLLRASSVGSCHQRRRWFAVAYDPDSARGCEALEQDGCEAQEVYGPGVLDQPDSDAGRTGPDRVTNDRWDEYTDAIARWEAVHGPAPEPTDHKNRLSPEFVEWMMGWPKGWTSVAGASRAQRLKMLGNGVVPHQAVHAYSQLLSRMLD